LNPSRLLPIGDVQNLEMVDAVSGKDFIHTTAEVRLTIKTTIKRKQENLNNSSV
jgi:hypothetical protein